MSKLSHSFGFRIRYATVCPIDVQLVVRMKRKKLKLRRWQREIFDCADLGVGVCGCFIVFLIIEFLQKPQESIPAHFTKFLQ